LEEHIEALKVEFEARPPVTISEAAERIAQLTGCVVLRPRWASF
jgi:hypothetical protein